MAKAKSKSKAAKKPSKKAASKSTIARVKNRTIKLASNPLVGEVVAATLVAAAAALKNPKKARALAEAAADEIGTASKEMASKGSAMWTLAMDVARKSLAAIASEDQPSKPKKPAKKQGKKKPKK